MKYTFLYFLLISLLISTSCKKDDFSDSNADLSGIDFKQEMRNFVQGISTYSKSIKAGMLIIPQNGHQILTQNGEPQGPLATSYITAIDGIGREDLFYGYDNDNTPTKASDQNEMLPFLNIAKDHQVKVLVTDYCSNQSYMDDSYTKNKAKGFISFAADHRELDHIPAYPVKPYAENNQNITNLSAAQNFLYVLNTASYTSKAAFLDAVKATNYDAIIMDLFFNDIAFSNTEIQSLKTKANGGKRLVICYMSIGEAEDYRYYWNDTWKSNKPAWLEKENPEWQGNYKVYYWNKEWQNIIYGNDQSYVKKITDAGFDGLYLDIIDAFDYFENK
ncbi:endo alpha-1,4 polygalactosaminidase [Xanthocytophaga flava]|uniref:endo alpha-1,4 polygalactosaminidase n=1 Tax=Xanthocytophaga flava TaxID=3048013 RepID=UPI0028D839A0|nr:endo alpha-1,4 polygalactosaminidase [Xanthocytophaga flavus]MDJ1467606.1 endo alpha-1,4 polygalactosaminidase [Xanthocytophaga flavus]